MTSCLIGIPVGAVLAIARFPGRSIVVVFVNALMGLPPVVIGLIVYLGLSHANSNFYNFIPFVIGGSLRVSPGELRIVPVLTGGSFGSKVFTHKIIILTAGLSRLAGVPVKYIEDRLEHFTNSDSHGSDRLYDAELAVDADGAFKSLRFTVLDDYGAYLQFGVGTHGNAMAQVTGPYQIGSFGMRVIAVLTNKTQQGPYRGFGSEVTNWVMMVNDSIDSIAITRDSIAIPGLTPDLRITALFGLHDIDRDDNAPDGSARLFGLFTEADLRKSTVNLDAAYVFSNNQAGGDAWFFGASAIQRIGHFNTAFRVNASVATETRGSAVDDGVLLFGEISKTATGSENIMKALIATEPGGRDLVKAIEPLDLLDLTDAEDGDLETVKSLAWAVKTLFHRLQSKQLSDAVMTLPVNQDGSEIDRVQMARLTGIMVSLHQVEYALNYCPRTIALRNGKVVYDGPSKALTPHFLGELYGAESEELFLPGLSEQMDSPKTAASAGAELTDAAA